ncbi:Autophagy-related protein 2-like B, partial [Fragariocoptes setiger]
GVRYLLHHYLGHFFNEKLTLEQLSIDIYEGKGSIKDLALDVDGLNDELDFVPFHFLDGCSIGQISVEVPWKSLSSDACQVQLDGATFVCRLKTDQDLCRSMCHESTLLTRSLMTSSMQMAEEIVTTEDDDFDSPSSSQYRLSHDDDHDDHADENDPGTPAHHHDRHQCRARKRSLPSSRSDSTQASSDGNNMFEGLEMFAQLIDSVLRRTKLSAYNTIFKIQDNTSDVSEFQEKQSDVRESKHCGPMNSSTESNSKSTNSPESDHQGDGDKSNISTVEFSIKYFRCEEILNEPSTSQSTNVEAIPCDTIINNSYTRRKRSNTDNEPSKGDTDSTQKSPASLVPETITKLLTLEDVEMRIDGVPVSNLVGQHIIKIKYDGQRSEMFMFLSSPLLAVIHSQQLDSFLKVFRTSGDAAGDNKHSSDEHMCKDGVQKIMRQEDYAKIEDQLLQMDTSMIRLASPRRGSMHHVGSPSTTVTAANHMFTATGRRWTNGSYGQASEVTSSKYRSPVHRANESFKSSGSKLDGNESTASGTCFSEASSSTMKTNTTNAHQQQLNGSSPLSDRTEKFFCEVKLPGVWLCVLRDDGPSKKLISPYTNSNNSFADIDKFLDKRVKGAHIRALALRVSLAITSNTFNTFLGDLRVVEYTGEIGAHSQIRILSSDYPNQQLIDSSRYQIACKRNESICLSLLTKTTITLDPRFVDRLALNYSIMKLFTQHCRSAPMDGRMAHRCRSSSISKSNVSGGAAHNLNLTIKGDAIKIELLCPIPDLRPSAERGENYTPRVRDESFLFMLTNSIITWQSNKLEICASRLQIAMKSKASHTDAEATKFMDAQCEIGETIALVMEPSPTNLDNTFLDDEIDQALNEASMYDSIYVSHDAAAPKSSLGPFKTERKVFRSTSAESSSPNKNPSTTNTNRQSSSNDGKRKRSNKDEELHSEHILTPGDRQHFIDYLNQTLMSTKLSMMINMPRCEFDFASKQQLETIYNRFGNDFVFWKPQILSAQIDAQQDVTSNEANKMSVDDSVRHISTVSSTGGGRLGGAAPSYFSCMPSMEDSATDSEVSFHSFNLDPTTDPYHNEATIKIEVAHVILRLFEPDDKEGQTSCDTSVGNKLRVAYRQMNAQKVMLGIVLDVNNRPSTILCLASDHVELANELTSFIQGNVFGECNAKLNMAVEIKRPSPALKEIKFTVRLANAILRDFETSNYKQLWHYINLADEPVLGYISPKIVVEIYVDIAYTALALHRAGARAALLMVDELYLTSTVVEKTSQVMLRMLIDEGSLYLKRNRRGLDMLKNYICVIDSGMIDINIKMSEDGRIEFSVANNVITVRVCHDSLWSLMTLLEKLGQSNEASIIDEPVSASCGKQSKAATVNETTTLEQRLARATVVKLSVAGPRSPNSSVGSASATIAGGDPTCNWSPPDIGGACWPAADSNQRRLASSYRRDSADMALLHDAMNDLDIDYEPLAGGKDRMSCHSKTIEEAPESPPQFFMSHRESHTDVSNDDSDSNDDEQRVTHSKDIYHHEGDDEYDSESADHDDHQPLMKTNDGLLCSDLLTKSEPNIDPTSPLLVTTTPTPTPAPCSDYDDAFFILGADDVGAGIIDTKLQEPVVRQLTNEPIKIVENYFNTAKPRALPDISSFTIEHYVLEETTLVINIYGGRDFDDDDDNDNASDDDEANDELGKVRSRSSILKDGCKSGKNQNEALQSKQRSFRRRHNSESGARSDKFPPKTIEAQSTAEGPRVRFGDGAVNLWESLDLMSAPELFARRGTSRGSANRVNIETKCQGGTWRQTDACVQLNLTKIKSLYELCNNDAPFAWRFMLFIQDIEIRDKVAASNINKLLYEYCTESMPRRNNTNMVAIETIAARNVADQCEECDLKISVKPLRLNIDQDTLIFLIEFFSSFNTLLNKSSQTRYGASSGPNVKTSASPSSGKSGSNSSASSSPLNLAGCHATVHDQNATMQGIDIKTRGISENSDTSYSFGSSASVASSPPSPDTISRSSSISITSATTLTHFDYTPPGDERSQPLYFKSFTFSPDVPIRLDYHGKRVDFDQGALAGVLMGLAHLDHSELKLKRVHAKHGMRGIDRVIVFIVTSWMTDIKRNQLPCLLGGVGPMHSFIQLFQGVRDLVWMPIDQYRKDKRLVRGIQRGASSFSSSTAMAMIDLTNKFVTLVQCTAQLAHDIVTPPTSQHLSARYARQRASRHNHRHHNHHNLQGANLTHPSYSAQLNQPRNFCEGMTQAYAIMREGFQDTVRNVAVGMQADDMRGAVGELVRHIPSTILHPIISVTEGAQNVLVGLKNQLTPEARREAQDKWKLSERCYT